MRPRHVVKPQEKVLGAAGEGPVALANGRLILSQRVATARGAIEAETALVRAMKVDRSPVGSPLADPRTRAIVVIPGHQVVQPERGHVAYDGLARTLHDVAQRE